MYVAEIELGNAGAMDVVVAGGGMDEVLVLSADATVDCASTAVVVGSWFCAAQSSGRRRSAERRDIVRDEGRCGARRGIAGRCKPFEEEGADGEREGERRAGK